MNFVLFHIGVDFPIHVEHCIRNIQQFTPNSKIYFLTDKQVSFNKVETINVADFNSYKLLESNFFKNSYHASLFRNSLFRFFFINELIKKYSLKNVIHFDNDVLIYNDYTKFIGILQQNNISITPHSNEEYVCGTMYIRDNIDIICEFFAKLIFKDSFSLDQYAGQGFMPNEMRLLSKLNKETNCLSLLPILPVGEFSVNFDKFNSLFDPSSYGQHVGGTPDRPEGGWVAAQNNHRSIDQMLNKNTIEVVFENKLPYVKHDNKLIKLNNLHIHSKQLSKYT